MSVSENIYIEKGIENWYTFADAMKQKIAFHTLGCKLNFSETSTISRQFTGDGYQQVAFSENADIYVINSCSVTKNAEKRCNTLIRQALKRNPGARVIVVGCYSQINPEALQNIPGVAMVLGNAEKFNLFEHIKGLSAGMSASRAEKKADGKVDKSINSEFFPDKFIPSWSKDERTRSFFKIQDGCDYFCTYCTIPLARGHSRSDTIAGTIKTAQMIAGTNVREIVLSGVNIGDFGKLHKETFFDLLKELVSIEGFERIRISSVEPDLLHDNIIKLVADEPKLMPHFHIPLQSGSDKVLKAMGRRYDTRMFAGRVDMIRDHMPHACIAADLIVGFPSETEELFMQTYQFIKQAAISYTHVFTYSERENTVAYTMKDNVTVDERNRRSKIMHELSDEKKRKFYRDQKGLHTTILWENDYVDGYMHGFTENYVKAKTPYKASLTNIIQPVALNFIDNDGVYLI